MRLAWWFFTVDSALVLTLSACSPTPSGSASGSAGTTSGTDSDSDTTSSPTSSPSSTTMDETTGPTSNTTMDPPICGDGIVNGGEECDDGNASNNDACTVTCVLTGCGDGLVWDGLEECDDGNLDNDDGCLDDCTPNVCGDGYVNLGKEQCDDGNQVDNDGCTNACKLHVPGCGDGIIDDDEECDDGNLDGTDSCTPECLNNVCGDSHTYGGVEECDDGNEADDDGCYSDCTLNVCGDGTLNVGVEECDDGNDDDSDACPGSCLPASCGDSYIYTGFEKCDDGDANEDGLYNGCTTECTPNPACGDGALQVDEGEECDDGNTISEDGCSETCMKETPPECLNYTTLDEADRNVTFNDGPDGVTECDKTENGWFRLDGAAGSQMPTDAPEIYSCGTDAPGWLKGVHPKVEDEIVSRDVCFHWLGEPCNWSVEVQVRNCGEFYVYKLPDPPDTCLRYCGAD